MSVKTETSQRTWTTYTYTCMRCGADCTDDEDHGGKEVGGYYHLDHYTRVYTQRVESGGEGAYNTGERHALIYDLCGACFRSVVVPALEAAGLKPRVEESDW